MNTFANVMLWSAYLLSLYFAVFWLIVFLSDSNKKPKKKLKKWKEWPMVSIVTPAYNEEKTITETMKSLINLDYPRDKLELIIVDDGSTDKTSKLAKKIIANNPLTDIKLIRQKNAGKGAALNAGLKICKGQFFVVMDADSFVSSNALKTLLPNFTSDEISTVLPALKVKDPKNFIQRLQWYEYLINMFYKELMARLNCVHVAPGPFSVYRKAVLQKIGGFDENHNLTEDLEIVLRMQSHHYKIVQVLDTDVLTIAPDSIKELYAQRNRWYKGSIYNALNYKYMIFNKKYGDFGMIQMPTILGSGAIALVMILSIAYYTLKPYYLYLINLARIDFDLWTLVRDFVPRINFLDLNWMTLVVAIIMMGISITIFKKSHSSTKEELSKHGILPIAGYMFVYFLILGTMWIGISIDLLRGKRQKW